MDSPSGTGKPEETSVAPRVVIGIVVGFVVLFAVAMIINLIGRTGEEPTTSNIATPSGNAPNVGDAPIRTEAKPSWHMEGNDGCSAAPQKDIDALVDTLDDGGTVELSAAWKGKVNGQERTAIALMVRSEQGTIDQPHLVWLDIDGQWTAVTRGTVEESSTKEDLSFAGDSAVGAAIQCLTAGSR